MLYTTNPTVFYLFLPNYNVCSLDIRGIPDEKTACKRNSVKILLIKVKMHAYLHNTTARMLVALIKELVQLYLNANVKHTFKFHKITAV